MFSSTADTVHASDLVPSGIFHFLCVGGLGSRGQLSHSGKNFRNLLYSVDACTCVRLRRRLAYVRVVWTFFFEPSFPAGSCSVLGVAVLPSVVVRPKMLCIMAGMDQKDIHAATLWPRSLPTVPVACFGVVLLGCTSSCVLRLSAGPPLGLQHGRCALFPSGMSMAGFAGFRAVFPSFASSYDARHQGRYDQKDTLHRHSGRALVDLAMACARLVLLVCCTTRCVLYVCRQARCQVLRCAHGGQVQFHRNDGHLQDFVPHRLAHSGYCHGVYVSVDTVRHSNPCSTPLKQASPRSDRSRQVC